ncbi:hypothetical protein ACFY36_50580 [Actinoplanes sp. NPDC000266]
MDTTTLADAGTTDEQPDSPYLRYLALLRELGNRAFAVNTALLEAHLVDTPTERHHALTILHTRARGIAVLANEALGTASSSKQTA